MNRLQWLATLLFLCVLAGCVTQTPGSTSIVQEESLPREDTSLPEPEDILDLQTEPSQGESESEPEPKPEPSQAEQSENLESTAPDPVTGGIAQPPEVSTQPAPLEPEVSRTEPSLPPESPSQPELPSSEEPGTPLNSSDLFSAPAPPSGGTLYSSSERAAEGEIDAAAFELELLRLINAERSANGREPLGLEENMQWAARIRAPEVLQDLSHTRPDGTSYYTAFDEAGFAYAGKWHGENVSNMYFTKGYFDTNAAAAYMFNQLKASPGHYTNMLNENFSQAGIGVFVQEDEEGMVRVASAQMFAGL